MIHPIKWIVDASTAVKWFVPEPDSARALVLLSARRAGQATLLAPDFILAEFGNVLWKKVRRGEISAADADGMMRQILATRPVTLHSTRPLVRPALQLASTYGRSVYDSLYLALAVREGCSMVTADQRLVNSLRGTPLAGSVVALSSI